MLGTVGKSRVALGLATAVLCGARLGQAQDPGGSPGGSSWTLEGLHAGQCVRFLMDAGAAEKHLRDGIRLLRADQVQALHPALHTVIEGQPEFASWIPSSLCLFYVDAVRFGGRRFGKKDPQKRQMIGAWTIATAEQGSGARRDLVLDLFGTGRDVARSADLAKVKFREAKMELSHADSTGNDLHDVRIGKTRLVWNGRAAGDSTRVEPIQESWLARGVRGSRWVVSTTITPRWSRSLVGALRVEGKDDLAKALKASPTRFVGPVYYGGGVQLRFSR